jgi:hypothetical protein
MGQFRICALQRNAKRFDPNTGLLLLDQVRRGRDDLRRSCETFDEYVESYNPPIESRLRRRVARAS